MTVRTDAVNTHQDNEWRVTSQIQYERHSQQALHDAHAQWTEVAVRRPVLELLLLLLALAHVLDMQDGAAPGMVDAGGAIESAADDSREEDADHDLERPHPAKRPANDGACYLVGPRLRIMVNAR
jgi:hypothetical protein